MSDQSPSFKEQIQETLDRPTPAAVYEPHSALQVDIHKTLKRLGIPIDDPRGDALPSPIRIDFTYRREMKGLPIGSTGKSLLSVARFINDAESARGVRALVRLFEDTLKVPDLSPKDVRLTDVGLTRFVRIEADE